METLATELDRDCVIAGEGPDVLWFGLPRPKDPAPPTLGYLSSAGRVLTIDRGEIYQSGLIIKKGSSPSAVQAGREPPVKLLQRIQGRGHRVIGVGLRPEHVRTLPAVIPVRGS